MTPSSISTLLAAMVHQLDPFIIELAPGIGLRWYGMAYIGGALLAYVIARWLASRGWTDLPAPLAFDFCLTALMGAFIGGRIGFCLLYSPQLLGFTADFPFWGVLALQKGGMASHGGIIGMVLAIMWFARKHHLSAWHLLDLACLAGPTSLVLGRIANFINGELYGRPCPPNLAWGVKFPKEIFAWSPDELTKLTPVVHEIGVGANDWQQMLDDPMKNQQEIYFSLEQIVRAIEQHQANVLQAIEPVLTARYPSQLIQAGLEGLAVLALVACVALWPRKPGVIAGWFVLSYAVARIVGEQFRMPDNEIGFEWFGLTRGQELSILMVLIGIAMILFAMTRRVAMRPGLLQPKRIASE